jgi:hypothetical protein
MSIEYGVYVTDAYFEESRQKAKKKILGQVDYEEEFEETTFEEPEIEETENNSVDTEFEEDTDDSGELPL